MRKYAKPKEWAMSNGDAKAFDNVIDERAWLEFCSKLQNFEGIDDGLGYDSPLVLSHNTHLTSL